MANQWKGARRRFSKPSGSPDTRELGCTMFLHSISATILTTLLIGSRRGSTSMSVRPSAGMSLKNDNMLGGILRTPLLVSLHGHHILRRYRREALPSCDLTGCISKLSVPLMMILGILLLSMCSRYT